MYSTKDFAKIRILKSNGEQREITVENLSSYKIAQLFRSTITVIQITKDLDQAIKDFIHTYFLGFFLLSWQETKISKDIVLREKTLPSRTVMPILTVTSHFTLTQEIKHHSPEDGQAGLSRNGSGIQHF